MTSEKVLIWLDKQPVPHPDPFFYHPDAADYDFDELAETVLRWSRPRNKDSTPWNWRPGRTPGVGSDVLNRRIVYSVWIGMLGWDHQEGRLASMPEGRMVGDALRVYASPGVRKPKPGVKESPTVSPSKVWPVIPSPPSSFQRCFKHFLDTGLVLAEVKREMEKAVVAAAASGPAREADRKGGAVDRPGDETQVDDRPSGGGSRGGRSRRGGGRRDGGPASGDITLAPYSLTSSFK